MNSITRLLELKERFLRLYSSARLEGRKLTLVASLEMDEPYRSLPKAFLGVCGAPAPSHEGDIRPNEAYRYWVVGADIVACEEFRQLTEMGGHCMLPCAFSLLLEDERAGIDKYFESHLFRGHVAAQWCALLIHYAACLPGIRRGPSQLLDNMCDSPFWGCADLEIHKPELACVAAIEHMIEQDSQQVCHSGAQSIVTHSFGEVAKAARDTMKGKERAFMDLLIAENGYVPLSTVAEEMQWIGPCDDPYNSLQKRVNKKLIQLGTGFQVRRRDNAAQLMGSKS